MSTLIFDMDGVLVNTVTLHHKAWQHVADRAGVTLHQHDLHRFRGRRRDDCLQQMFAPQTLSQEQLHHYSQMKDIFYHAALAEMSANDLLMSGARDLLINANKAGHVLGVASSSVNTHRVLQQAEISHFFEVIADGYTVVRSKPASDLFIWVAGALDTSPQDCIVFEDSQAGIEAAITMGAFAVGIGDCKNTVEAHIHYEDLSMIDLNTLLEYANMQRPLPHS